MKKPSRGRPNLRSQLINAACELLREQGPLALTARAIAQRAGVAEATVFNNFGDLRGLLVAVGREGFPEYDTLIECIHRGPQDELVDWLIEVFELNRLYMLAVLPLSVQQLNKQEPKKKGDNALVGSIQRALCQQLEMLKENGRIRDGVDIAAASMLLVAGGGHAALTELTTGLHSVVGEDRVEVARRVVLQLGIV